ncbi:hypothetical protein JKP88DRAFT_251679 [Tribonema minus]|uniref:Uncharacterized protein n=1 Tax=Tribonema minus TaxID=303371 RepID=A0A835ZFP6_9STRA|nr:hypothetical protein JKP88DRAFT_251679 [Tribonema minus]
MPPRKKKGRSAAPAPLVPHEVSEIMDWLGTDHLAPGLFVSHAWQGEIMHRHPELQKLGKLNTYQRNTWHNLSGFRLTNVIAAVQRQCVLCHTRWQGGINCAFGIPAHPKCVRQQLLLSIPPDLPRQFAYSHLPHQSIEGWTRHTGDFSLDGFWNLPHPAIPREWTIMGLLQDKEDEISAFREEEEQSRVEELQRRADVAQVGAASAKVLAQDRDNKWRKDVAAEAARQNAPFSSWSGLQKSLRGATSIPRTVLRHDAQETVRRAALVLREAAHIPKQLLHQAFLSFDAQRVSLFREYAPRVQEMLWNCAFADGELENLEIWSHIPAMIGDECSALFVQATAQHIDGSALCALVVQHRMETFMPLLIDACRTATDMSDFERLFDDLDILLRRSEVATYMVHRGALK